MMDIKVGLPLKRSKLAARLNGFVAGFGSPQQFEDEWRRYMLQTTLFYISSFLCTPTKYQIMNLNINAFIPFFLNLTEWDCAVKLLNSFAKSSRKTTKHPLDAHLIKNSDCSVVLLLDDFY